MIKITTKRDEREEEALREEGREQARREDSDKSFEIGMKREHLWMRDARLVPAHDLRVGDFLFETNGIRSGYRGQEITYADTKYPNREGVDGYNGQPCSEGKVWIEYKGDPERGVLGSGGSLIDADDVILIVGEARNG